MSYTAFYAQVISLGFFWVTFHCAGMCGPIIAGVTSAAQTTRARIAMVLAYQSGRALTYIVIGAAAGSVGAAFEQGIGQVTQVAGLALAGVMFVVGLTKIPAINQRMPKRLNKLARASGVYIARALTLGARLGGSRSRLFRTFVTGMFLGLLPCMLMFWVLGVAAATASPVHGAGVMLLLVLMTTPTLTAVSCAAALPFKGIRGDKLVPWALMLSGVWLGLIAAAANGWIEHVHLPFKVWGEQMVFMLW